MKQKVHHLKQILLTLSVVLSAQTISASAADNDVANQQPPVFATIGKVTISWQEVESEYKKEAKNKFFHGKPASDVVAALQRTVADKLVTNALVLNEAYRRKLKPDADAVNQDVKDFEAKFANDAQWAEARDRVLPIITKRFQDGNLIKKLESRVRQVPLPTTAQVKAFYTNHPEKFTSPLEQRVSVILLSVDPSSGTDVWEQTKEDAKILIRQIQEGEDFAEMAKQYSRDAQTVDQGGDMGYLHEGMLPGLAQETVNKLKIGDISEPTRLMEGIAIFRLTDRKTPGLSSFESVKQRAQELLLAEQSDKAWNTLIANLRARTPMRIDESRFLPLAAAEGSGSALPGTTTK